MSRLVVVLVITWESSAGLFAQANFERPQNYRVQQEFVNPYDRIPAYKQNTTNNQEPYLRKPFVEKQYPQDLEELIGLHQSLLKKQKEQEGFRIQIVSTTDQSVIKKARMEFSELNTPLKIYQVYDRPYYKLRVGDFLTKFEAEQMVYVLLRSFPASFVVPDKVKVH